MQKYRAMMMREFNCHKQGTFKKLKVAMTLILLLCQSGVLLFRRQDPLVPFCGSVLWPRLLLSGVSFAGCRRSLSLKTSQDTNSLISQSSVCTQSGAICINKCIAVRDLAPLRMRVVTQSANLDPLI